MAKKKQPSKNLTPFFKRKKGVDFQFGFLISPAVFLKEKHLKKQKRILLKPSSYIKF